MEEDRLRIRAKLLMLFEHNKGLTYKEIQSAIGAKSIGSAHNHIAKLEKEGFIHRKGGKGGIYLTEIGEMVRDMLKVTRDGDKIIHKIIEKPNREKFIDFRDAARRLDDKYSKSTMSGILGKSSRRASGSEIVSAVRSCSTYQEAADKLGIDRKTLDQRINGVVKEMEKNSLKVVDE